MSGTGMVLKKATLRLEGMSCASCAQTIEKALNKAKGVHEAQVNLFFTPIVNY